MSELAMLIDQDGATLDASDGDVLTTLRSAQGDFTRVGTRAIDSVVVDADTLFSTRALQRMALHGVALVILGRGRQPQLCWAQPGGTGARLRHAQHLATADAPRWLALAVYLLRHKLNAQIASVEAGPGCVAPPALCQAPDRLARASDASTLRGIEGAAAGSYWALWGRQWPATWGFKGRERRPATDPVNALLSLGYTLATGEAARQLAQVGLDPWLGVLHETRPPAAALALDLVEGTRAQVDTWVCGAVQRLELKPCDFERESDGSMRLGGARRRDLYADWFAAGLPAVRRHTRQVLKGFTTLLEAGLAKHTFPRAITDSDDSI